MRLSNSILSALILGLTTVSTAVIASAQDKEVREVKKSISTQSKLAGATDKSLLIVTPEYFIGPEDILEITVWKNADLSKTVQVRPDGRISLPLLGDIVAVAKTPTQLTEEISSGLKSYMENPTISILVKDVNSYQLYVLGEVNKPGKYP